MCQGFKEPALLFAFLLRYYPVFRQFRAACCAFAMHGVEDFGGGRIVNIFFVFSRSTPNLKRELLTNLCFSLVRGS